MGSEIRRLFHRLGNPSPCTGIGREGLPSSDPPDQQGVGNAELNDGVELLSPFLQELIQLQQQTPTSEGLREQGPLVLREGGAGAAPEQGGTTYHLRLFHRAGEAVQEEPVLAGRGVQVVLNQLHHHLIAHLQRGDTYVVRRTP